MFEKIIQMSKDLIAMDTDTYYKCKYVLKTHANGNESLTRLLDVLFELVEEKRPLLLEMH